MRQSAARRLHGLQVRIPLWAWVFVTCQRRCWTVRWRPLVRWPCVRLVTQQRSPKLRGVSEFDREAWTTRRPWPNMGCRAMKKQIIIQLSLPPFHIRKIVYPWLILFDIRNSMQWLCGTNFKCDLWWTSVVNMEDVVRKKVFVVYRKV
jgi:hypothetical protein